MRERERESACVCIEFGGWVLHMLLQAAVGKIWVLFKEEVDCARGGGGRGMVKKWTERERERQRERECVCERERAKESKRGGEGESESESEGERERARTREKERVCVYIEIVGWVLRSLLHFRSVLQVSFHIYSISFTVYCSSFARRNKA